MSTPLNNAALVDHWLEKHHQCQGDRACVIPPTASGFCSYHQKFEDAELFRLGQTTQPARENPRDDSDRRIFYRKQQSRIREKLKR